MSERSDDRPTRELRPTEVQMLLRGPHAVNLEVELDDARLSAVPIAPRAAGSDHALALAGAPQQRPRVAMRALTPRMLRYPRAPGGPPIAVRLLAILVALLAAYVVALLV